MDEFFVYVDAIEETGEVIYCGKGNKGRIKHFKRNKKYNSIKNKYKINRVIIPTLDEQLAFLLEKWFIDRFHTCVYDTQSYERACNFTFGGEGSAGHKPSKETLEKRSRSMRGKNKGKTFSHTQESKNKIRIARSKQIMSPRSKITKDKISKSNKNKLVSDETRKKISNSSKGKKRSKEHQGRLNESNKGKHSNPLSDEHKRKLSEASKRYYEKQIHCLNITSGSINEFNNG